MRVVTTAAFQSGDLAINSTYYVRGKIVDGELVIYTTRGVDTDTIPASLVGTVDAAAGGGFDSTVLDVLLAKVVTGAAGSAPVVTDLANAARLMVAGSVYPDTMTNSGLNAAYGSYKLEYKWGRKPAIKPLVMYSALYATDAFDDFNYYQALTYDRYKVSGEAMWDYATSSSYLYVRADA
jgi:hypothetical protein